MASIHIRFGEITPGSDPVFQRVPRKSETVTSSGTSAQSTNTANSGEYVCITALDGSVYSLVGENPTALASGAGMEAIPSGGFKVFGPLKDLDKVAVIDV